MNPRILVILILLALHGCASNRFFTDEEDAKAREACSESGCVVVPVPILRLLLDRLRGIVT